MTTAAALEVWNKIELRRELLKIAKSGTAGDPAKFYARAWALITRLRAGQPAEVYLSRVIVECCRPKWARGLRAWQAPIERHRISDEEPAGAEPTVRKNELDE